MQRRDTTCPRPSEPQHINVKIAERVGLEVLPWRFFALDLGETRDVMALQAAVQRCPAQMRHRRETIVQRRQCVPPERDYYRLLFERHNRGFCILRPACKIGDGCSLAPLGHGLLIDPTTRRERPRALFTILYCTPLRDCHTITCHATDGSPQSSWRRREGFVPQCLFPGKDSKSGIRQLQFYQPSGRRQITYFEWNSSGTHSQDDAFILTRHFPFFAMSSFYVKV